MKTLKLSVLLMTSVISFNLSAQVLGSLDTSFYFIGKLTTDFNGGTDGASAVLIQPDGKIVAAGYSGTGNNYQFALCRYNVDGYLDTTFGGTGKVLTDFSAGYDQASCVALQTDGKIIAGGSMYNGGPYINALVRYNTDGTLDNTFGLNGKVSTPVGTSDAGITSIAIQPDGKIIASCLGTTPATARDFAMVRYDTDGTLDNTFGTGGKVLTDFSNSYDFAFSVSLQTDGKIVLGGATGNGSDTMHFALARFDSIGNVDQTFGTNGFVVTNFGKLDEWGNATVIQPDGKIIIAGMSGSPYKYALARYNTNGSLDTTFNSTGKVLSALSTHDEATSLALETGGNIVVAGVSYNVNNHNFSVARYNSNGILDNTFGPAGFVTTDFGSNADKATGVAIQANGRIVAAGVKGNDFAVARYLAVLYAGIIDFESMNNSVFIYPNPIAQTATLNYILKEATPISIFITDAQGKLVQSIIDNQMQTATAHQQTITLNNDLPHGTYFIIISNSNQHMSIKIIK